MTDPAYHLDLGDEERANIERTSFNFFTSTGQMMRIPPRLYSDLRASGVSMRYIIADASLEQ